MLFCGAAVSTSVYRLFPIHCISITSRELQHGIASSNAILGDYSQFKSVLRFNSTGTSDLIHRATDLVILADPPYVGVTTVHVQSRRIFRCPQGSLKWREIFAFAEDAVEQTQIQRSLYCAGLAYSSDSSSLSLSLSSV